MKTRFISSLVFVSLLAIPLTVAQANDFEATVEAQRQVAVDKLIGNINPRGTLPGTVIASPSRSNPDYFFHWVRDAALVMDVVIDLYEKERNPIDSFHYEKLLKDFVSATLVRQKNSGISNLGEPKYLVDGRPYTGPWGRPQNDGPALRASTLIRFYKLLQKKNPHDPFLDKIFDRALDSKSAVRTDLKYLLKEYKSKSFDLWEEIKADNFYTRMVQIKAFKDGASLAKALGGSRDIVRLYESAAQDLEFSLPQHFDLSSSRLKENIHRVEGIHYKDSGLDTATVLAFNHTHEVALSRRNRYVLNTIEAIELSFNELYSINRVSRDVSSVAPGIGRYPEDQYYGGNPWFLTTLAFAEYFYELAAETGRPVYFDKADSFLKRVFLHKGNNYQLDEQFSRDNGFMLSARDLTWSYGAFITASDARERAKLKIRK